MLQLTSSRPIPDSYAFPFESFIPNKTWRIKTPMASYFKALREKLPPGTRYVVGAAVGAAAVPLIGMAAGAAVPWAMSTFVTVVPGVGTIRTAGGVSTTLQWASTVFTNAAAWCGAMAGAVASAAGGSHQHAS